MPGLDWTSRCLLVRGQKSDAYKEKDLRKADWQTTNQVIHTPNAPKNDTGFDLHYKEEKAR